MVCVCQKGTVMSTDVAPLTLARAIQLAEEVVAEYGKDFQYCDPDNPTSGGGCFYAPLDQLTDLWDPDDNDDAMPWEMAEAIRTAPVDDPRRTTACLVGNILTRHGFTDHLTAMVGVGHLNPDEIRFDSLDAEQFLAALQDVQDNGGTWGRALKRGLAEVQD